MIQNGIILDIAVWDNMMLMIRSSQKIIVVRIALGDNYGIFIGIVVVVVRDWDESRFMKK